MDQKTFSYGSLCSFYYDATEGFASENEVLFFADFIKRHPGGRVLEAMSGSGRLQIPLMQLGFIIDGVDRSPSMLMRCRERCAALGLTPELYEQSLEELALPHHYTTVIIASGSFQLIVERDVALKALKNLRHHMTTDSDLLIDIFVPDITVASTTSTQVRIDNELEIRLTTRYVFDEIRKVADGICHYELLVDGQVKAREDELIEVVWYSDDELRALLAEAGFEIVSFYERSFRSAGPSRVVHARLCS